MNIGIIGIGGVGGYFGGKIARLLDDSKNSLKVYFFARGRHLEEIQKKGLLLSTKDEGEFVVKPTLATDNPEEIPELDICLVCVKSYDLENALSTIKNSLVSTTRIIPLLNGVDIYDRVNKVIDNAIIYPACAYVGTHIERYGKVSQTGGSCTILFGNPPRNTPDSHSIIFDLFKSAGIRYSYFDDVFPEIWAKYIFIASYGMVTASENKTIGQVLEDAESSILVKGIMEEIIKIAVKMNIDLEENMMEKSYDKGKSFPYETRTSFQRDFETADKLNEAELFGDTIMRLGRESGVDTPVTLLVNERLTKIKGK